MNDCCLIIVGATGDLSRKKIFPALYTLFMHHRLGSSAIIGAAITDLTREQFLLLIRATCPVKDEHDWQRFSERISYISADVTKESDFMRLHETILAAEQHHCLSGNRLVYCATAPYFYCDITKNLAHAQILEQKKADAPVWHRIVYEKPFGHDYQSALEINRCIAEHFNEHQIYRIDHYLTKELVGTLALIRFTNLIFEPLWNNRFIDQVHIIFNETEGIDKRGAYYDRYGALADVLQNHVMQLVALVGMEAPEKLIGNYIRTERARVLQKVKVIDALLGQYQGYTSELNVSPHSTTETFARVYLRIDNPRWAGVPFFVQTGKCLPDKTTAIYIKFKQVDCLLSKACPSESNALTIQISPNPIFSLMLNTKKPGKKNEVVPVQMQFSHDAFGTIVPEAYQTLFEEIIAGEESLSVRFDEIEYAWRIIDEIRALKRPVVPYEKNKGPVAAINEFDAKHGVRYIRNEGTK